MVTRGARRAVGIAAGFCARLSVRDSGGATRSQAQCELYHADIARLVVSRVQTAALLAFFDSGRWPHRYSRATRER